MSTRVLGGWGGGQFLEKICVHTLWKPPIKYHYHLVYKVAEVPLFDMLWLGGKLNCSKIIDLWWLVENIPCTIMFCVWVTVIVSDL